MRQSYSELRLRHVLVVIVAVDAHWLGGKQYSDWYGGYGDCNGQSARLVVRPNMNLPGEAHPFSLRCFNSTGSCLLACLFAASICGKQDPDRNASGAAASTPVEFVARSCRR